MAKDTISKYLINEIENMISKGEYHATGQDTPEYSIDPEFWENAKISHPKAKKSVHLRLEEDVLEWFKAQGPVHLTRMQAVLKSFYEAKSHH